MSATHISDGAQVLLQKLITASSADEIAIGHLFSSKPHWSHAGNHCIPLLDVFTIPDQEDTTFLVLPFLSDWEHPKFTTVGKTIAFFKQIFEVCDFLLNMQQHNVSDCLVGPRIHAQS
jgi:hypothetical protein